MRRVHPFRYALLMMAMLGSVTFVSGASAAGLYVEVVVDTEVCASGGIQCGGAYGRATDENHNPIKLVVETVKLDGLPLTGLNLSNFTFSNAFVPAGGGAAGICTEANCTAARFQSGGNGLYSIFLDRIPSGNWKAGMYAGALRVKAVVGTTTYNGTALVTFKIPDANDF